MKVRTVENKGKFCDTQKSYEDENIKNFKEQESIRSKANYPLRDRNPNTYNSILELP